jgi:hypothetical protein
MPKHYKDNGLMVMICSPGIKCGIIPLKRGPEFLVDELATF